MHKLLVQIFEDHPGKTIYLTLGKFPHVLLENGAKALRKGSDEPLGPEKMAEIINSLIAEQEGASLKTDCFVDTQMADKDYLRKISIQYDETGVDVRIISTPWNDVEAEEKIVDDTVKTLLLIKGKVE